MGLLPVAGLLLNITLTLLASSLPDRVAINDESRFRYEWRANTFTRSLQADATLCVLPGGDTWVAWSSRRQNEGRSGVFAQRFDRDGVAVGGEFALSLWPASHQTRPALAAASDGSVWAVWHSFGQDGDQGAIIARRFDRDGAGGDEILVNSTTAGDQTDPVLAAAAGRVVIAWASRPPGAHAHSRVFARIYAANATPLGDEFPVASAADRNESSPSAAVRLDATIALAFAVARPDGRPDGIRMRLIASHGAFTGDEINVCGDFRDSQIEPVVAAIDAGFAVCWLDGESDGDDYGVLARVFASDGRPRSAPSIVNQRTAGLQNAAAIAALPDAGFLVAYNSRDASKTGVFARRLDCTGLPVGDEFRFSRWTIGRQELRAAGGTSRLVTDADRILVAWSGDGGRGDSSGVHVTTLANLPAIPADRVQGVTHSMSPAAPPRLAHAGGPQPHEPPLYDPAAADPDAERDFSATASGDFGFTAVTNTGWTPPDPSLAVGPLHVVVTTNGAIAFFTKDGVKTFQAPIEGAGGFWGSLGATNFVFDPEVLYDPTSGRFFAIASEWIQGVSSFILVAVSDDSDPNGTWYKYRLNTTALAGDLFDSPNLAVDAAAVYITGDGFPAGGPNYPIFIYDKASLLVGNPPAVTRSLLLPTSTQSAGIPPVSFDNPPALWMIEHAESNPATTVRLISLRNPLTTPTLSTFTLTVPAYNPPADPPQQGTSVRPETFDARFWSCATRRGRLWATHHVGSSVVRARWYEIDMRGWPTSGQNPILVQSGEHALGAAVHTTFTAITASANGNAAMTFARSAANEFISMYSAMRLKNDPLGTFGNGVVRATSNAGYTSNRWGDYSAVAVDPADHRSFWAVHEYAVGQSWRTWVQRFAPPFSLGDTNCDGSVNPFDIGPFFTALTDPAAYQAQYPDCDLGQADIDQNGSVNPFDIQAFINLLGS